MLHGQLKFGPTFMHLPCAGERKSIDIMSPDHIVLMDTASQASPAFQLRLCLQLTGEDLNDNEPPLMLFISINEAQNYESALLNPHAKIARKVICDIGAKWGFQPVFLYITAGSCEPLVDDDWRTSGTLEDCHNAERVWAKLQNAGLQGHVLVAAGTDALKLLPMLARRPSAAIRDPAIE